MKEKQPGETHRGAGCEYAQKSLKDCRQCGTSKTCYLCNAGRSKCFCKLSVLHSASCCGDGSIPLKAVAPPCISAGASHHPLLLLPAVGQAALHCLQFTLLCIPTFSLTSCLDVLTVQNSFSQHTPSPAAHQCRKNPLHSPSYSGLANGDKDE